MCKNKNNRNPPTLSRDIIEADPVAFSGHEHGLQRLVLDPSLDLCQVAAMTPTELKRKSSSTLYSILFHQTTIIGIL